jgi:predicted MFS family arabinose efflux permease
LTTHLWHLYVVFLLLGLVGNGTAQMAYARSVSSWFDRHRGAALALVMSGGAIGAIVLPPAAETLIQRVGWRGACLTLGGMVLAIGVPIAAAFIRERPSAVPHDRTRRVDGVSARQGLASGAFWILVAVLFCNSIAQNGALTHMSALLTDRGVSANGAALSLSAMGGASLAGRLVTGWLIDRFFAPRVAFAMLAMAALGTLLLSDAHSLRMGVTAAVLIGLGMGSEADVTPYLLSRYFGLRSVSVLFGFTWTFYAAAGAIGPILMGRAFDVTGSYEALLVRLALATVAVASLLLFLPRYASAVVEPL